MVVEMVVGNHSRKRPSGYHFKIGCPFSSKPKQILGLSKLVSTQRAPFLCVCLSKELFKIANNDY